MFNSGVGLKIFNLILHVTEPVAVEVNESLNELALLWFLVLLLTGAWPAPLNRKLLEVGRSNGLQGITRNAV